MPNPSSATGERRRKWRVLVTHNTIASSAVELLNAHDCDVFFSPPYDASDVVAARAAELGIDAIMVRQGQISEAVIAASPNLKVIVKHGVGVDNVDIQAAADRGVPVLRSMGSNARAVAEHAIALSLALLKEIGPLTAAVKNGRWPKPTFMGRDIAGTVMGLVGYGAIGRETAAMARALGMDVIVYDPHAAAGLAEERVETVSDVDDLVRRADIVSLHCPLTAETRHLIDARRLSLMRPTSFIVNTARGGLVDEAALASALRDKRIAGAALDSFATEPPAADNPLWAAPDLLATPHIGGVTKGSSKAMAEIAARHIIRVLGGEEPDAFSLATPQSLGLRKQPA
ncbi:hydroxyacid dehydrogenase [Ensifer adhaerens]|uniref:hydroxyacid dehydrogenase n=1 Tax=Ensifer adhaerens TaxID=106592 RepID=UPI000CF0236D|nr:hydroxyacid dehydrogenase [Ensifer adhaerens]